MGFLLITLVVCIFAEGIYGVPDSYGKEFVFTFPYISSSYGDLPHLLITTEAKEIVAIHVLVPKIHYSENYNVTAAQIADIPLPEEASITKQFSGKHPGTAVIVATTDNVSVYGIYRYHGSLILPTHTIGKIYVAVSYVSELRDGNYYGSEVAISAVQDNTTVTIYIDEQTQSVITLQQYESYQYVADGNVTDVTGAFIIANKPVSVISGHQCMLIPVNLNSCDYTMEHLPPISALGRHYILAPFMGRQSGYIFRVIATAQNTTNIIISDGNTTSLQPGQFYEDDITTDTVITITADKPVLVSQYAKGHKTDSQGDPFMIVIPSTQSYSHNVTFAVPSSPVVSNPIKSYISLVTQCNHTESLYVDQQLVDINNDVLQTPDGEFCVFRSPVSPGVHSVTQVDSNPSFLVLPYGVATFASYGYVAGYNIHTPSRIEDEYVTTDNHTTAGLQTGTVSTQPPEQVTSEGTSSSKSTTLLVGILSAAGLLIIAGIVVVVVVRHVKENRNQKNEEGDNSPIKLEDIGTGDDNGYLTPGVVLESVDVLSHPRNVNIDNQTIPRDQLKIIRELGSGQFGRVLLAEKEVIVATGVATRPEITTTRVAVKTIKEGASTFEKSNFLQELELMKKFKPHLHIVGLLGWCTEKEPYYIILEYMANGNLKEFLKNSRQLYDYASTRERDIQSSLTQTQLILFARQIADGMAFIASNKCIHRDLAARNVLLGKDLTCKVSDFGLARDIEDCREYERKSDVPLPIRWLALECLVDDMHTMESDVWSFGILLWEIITIGARPYPGMGAKAVIRNIREGYRMPQPKHCQKQVYDIMLACWASEPSARPTFNHLIKQLDHILEIESEYLILDEIEDSIYDDTALPDEEEKV